MKCCEIAERIWQHRSDHRYDREKFQMFPVEFQSGFADQGDRAEQQDRQNHLPENQTKRMMTGLHRHFGKWYRPAPQDAEKQQHHDQKRSAHVRNSDIDAHAFWLNIRT